MSMPYKAGVCNIGKTEIRKRYAFGAAGFVLAAIILVWMSVSGFSHTWFALLAIPLFAGFEGTYQGALHFCAGFGVTGRYDFLGTRKEYGKVTSQKEHKADIMMSLKIHAYSLWSAVLVTIVIISILNAIGL